MLRILENWLKKDGSVVDAEISAVILRDVKGTMTGTISSIRDITDRKRAEETLRSSEEKYRSLIEHANDAIISVNKDGVGVAKEDNGNLRN